MKRFTCILLLAALLGGCATSPTDTASSDGEVTGFLPFYQFDKKNDINWILPVAWSETGRFSVLPVFWWTKNWFILGPYASANEKSIGMLLPLIYWDNEIGNEHLWTLAGLWGYWRDYGKPPAHWLMPFYLRNNTGFFSIPWSQVDHETQCTDYYLCGLGGYERTPAAYRSSWFLPFYYHDQDGLYTPLFGNTNDSDWVTPFYYRNKADFHTLLWSSTDTGWWTLFGLIGSRTNVARSWRTNWVFPFYSNRIERDHKVEKSETSFLCGLYSVEHTRDLMTLWTTSLHRILFMPVWR